MAYSQKEKDRILNEIFQKISEGNSLRSVLKENGMPPNKTILEWIDKDEEKSKQYARAKEARADVIFEQIIEIADTPVEGEVIKENDKGTEITKGDMIQHRRLQVDARKWVLARMSPKKYGDRLEVDQTINDKRKSVSDLFPTEEELLEDVPEDQS